MKSPSPHPSSKKSNIMQNRWTSFKDDKIVVKAMIFKLDVVSHTELLSFLACDYIAKMNETSAQYFPFTVKPMQNIPLFET